MKVYTRTGDVGTSSLYDGKRIAKNTIIFDLLGELDELSCRIGMLCVLIPIIGFMDEHNRDGLVKFLRDIQSGIQDINSIIATTDKKGKILPEIIPRDVLKI
jgi:cob(I)alamin adenosyltransferase